MIQSVVMYLQFSIPGSRKELLHRLEKAGHYFEWPDIVQDQEALQETLIEENGKRLAIRSECLGILRTELLATCLIRLKVATDSDLILPPIPK